MTGQVARVGKSFQVNLRIISARDAAALFTYQKKVKTEEDLLEALDEAGDRAALKLAALAPPPEVVVTTRTPTPTPTPTPEPTPPVAVSEVKAAPKSSTKVAPWVLVGSGAAALVAGAVVLGASWSTYARLTGPVEAEWFPKDAYAAADVAATQQTIGIVCAAVGAAAVAGGVTWHFMTKQDIALSIAPAGPGFFVEARW